MKETVIKKERREYGGLALEINIGSIHDRLYFDNEAEFQGFVYLLHMMASMNAESVSMESKEPGPEKPQEYEETVAESGITTTEE